MKKICLISAFCCLCLSLFSQGLSSKLFRFSSFSHDKKVTPRLLDKLSSEQAKKHPEYGILPQDARCTGCVELIDKRREYSRQFIDSQRAGHTYSQQSYFPLHYLDEQGRWRTVDHRLRPLPGMSDVYAAPHQPMPVRFDFNEGYTSLDMKPVQFTFNHDLKMYFATDANSAAINPQSADYGHYTVGDDGARIFNMWQGIDMESFARDANVETNFIITAKPHLPIAKGFLVIEDHISLPAGYTIAQAGTGYSFEDQDLEVKDPQGRTRIVMGHVRIRNGENLAIVTPYVLSKNGNTYDIRMMVPISFLDAPSSLYPIVMDPIVVGKDSMGNFVHSGRPHESMQFIKYTNGHCDYHMIDTVPGQSSIVRTLIDLESATTSDPFCVVDSLHGGDPSQICLLRHIIHAVKSDSCNYIIPDIHCSTSGLRASRCDTPGVISTDADTVPGAYAIAVPYPVLLGCYQPQCDDYHIPFTLQNNDSTCLGSCSNRCAKGYFWKMTVEACRIEANMTAAPTTICDGQGVVATCHPSCGVPPYHYRWSNMNHDTTAASITFFPHQDMNIACTAFDTCNNYAITNDIQIHVIPSPSANAGDTAKLCEGGTATIGGNPTTTSASASTLWRSSLSQAVSWLSDSTVPNPGITVPYGTVDTFYYIVKVEDQLCFRLDSMTVFSFPNPVAVIDTVGSARICNGQTVILSVTGNYSSYIWNTGSSSSSITVSAPGPYYVIVTDSNRCRGTSNVVAVSQIQVPNIHVYPDTLIIYGDSVRLYTDISLSPQVVDSFYWRSSPAIPCPACPNPIVAPLDAQWYTLVVYSQGCTLMDSALIRVVLPDNYYIPDAFTPNNDGVNDSFYVYGQSGVKVISFRVYNRWGEKVHDGLYPWDGKFKGEYCQPGVYVYTFDIQLFGRMIDDFRKGSVTLIR